MATVPRFEPDGFSEAGEKLYSLIINGQRIRQGLTIGQVVEIINARDEMQLGAEHAPRRGGDGGHDPL